MWKCIRCEKENKDTAEICTECGHGRTMDYVQHRTLSKISAKLAKNWKISRNTEKEIEKLNNENRKKIQDLKKKYRQTQLQAKKDATRKNAEEVIQKKLSSLRSSVAFMKDEISKEQDEINTLHGTIEERTKLIDKDAKANKIITIIAWIIAIFLSVYLPYIASEGDSVQFCLFKPGGGMNTDFVVALIMVAPSILIVIFGMFPGYAIIAAIVDLLIGRFIGKISYNTLKQAET